MILNCPLCQSNDHTVIYDQAGYAGASVVKCNNCFHIYTLLQVDPEPAELYNDEVYKVVENRDSIFDKLLNSEYKKVVNRIGSFKPGKGALLDFGCGKGKFANLALQKGWEVKCVETAIERAEYARSIYGLEVSTAYYSSGKIYDGDFDVLTLFHVLEHLADPRPLLKELIRNNLKNDALVLIEVPNKRSWQSGIAGKKWMHLDIPRHISHFAPKRLDQFAKELGLVSKRTSHFSFHLGVLGMTDSLLKLFGYRRNIIYQLKNKKSIGLLFCIGLVLPFSFIMESFAAAIGRGGIVRKYFVRKQDHS